MPKLIRPRGAPPEARSAPPEMSDERATSADTKVKKFARSVPVPNSNNSMARSSATPESSLAPEHNALHSALREVGDQLLEYGHRPATMAHVAHGFHSLARKLKEAK
jgi:hypothetical protein